MATLRMLILLAQTLVIITIGAAGAAVLDSVFSHTWHFTMVSVSIAN